MNDVLYIVIPAYNEEENIGRTVSQWYSVVESHDGCGKSALVIVNDGSTDDTWRQLQELAKTRPLMIPLAKENEGHGPTLIYGYNYALEAGADWVFQTDPDGQTDPYEFSAFWDSRHDYDAQFGNRTERGDGKDRAFVERTLCRILHLFLGYGFQMRMRHSA